MPNREIRANSVSEPTNRVLAATQLGAQGANSWQKRSWQTLRLLSAVDVSYVTKHTPSLYPLTAMLKSQTRRDAIKAVYEAIFRGGMGEGIRWGSEFVYLLKIRGVPVLFTSRTRGVSMMFP